MLLTYIALPLNKGPKQQRVKHRRTTNTRTYGIIEKEICGNDVQLVY